VEAHPEFDNAICASQMAMYSGFQMSVYSFENRYIKGG
jgi:hypothetical protein